MKPLIAAFFALTVALPVAAHADDRNHLKPYVAVDTNYSPTPCKPEAFTGNTDSFHPCKDVGDVGAPAPCPPQPVGAWTDQAKPCRKD